MRNYDKDEAKLMAWKRELNTVETKRKELKETLLAIIESEGGSDFRLRQFNQQRNTLIGNNHGQGWTWNANFSWLWDFISSFLPNSWKKNPQPGSRLRQALAKEPDIEEFEPLSLKNTLIIADEEPNLYDLDFENALFLNPSNALIDLQTRIMQLDLCADKQQMITTVLERLNAIKFRLTADSYRILLEDLFQRYPKESLTYYYGLYRENLPENPEPHEFIEHHLMACALIDQFVPKYVPNEEINPRIFAFQALSVLLLSLDSTNDDPLLGLLAQGSKQKGKTFALLDEAYDELLERKNRSGSRLEVAKQIFASVASDKKQHPLLSQFARLACQEILGAVYTEDQRNNGYWKQGFDTVNFLGERILATWDAAGKPPFHIAAGVALLNPMLHSAVHPSYKLAEFYAITILMYSTVANNFTVQKVHELCTIGRNNLSEQEWDWIEFRVKKHISTALFEELGHILIKTAYDDDLPLSVPESNPIIIEKKPTQTQARHPNRATNLPFFSLEIEEPDRSANQGSFSARPQ